MTEPSPERVDMLADGRSDRPSADHAAAIREALDWICMDAERDRLREAVAAVWAYRIAYEAYWGEVMAWPEKYTVSQKQRYLDEVIAFQIELDKAIAALDDEDGDFEKSKRAAKLTVARAALDATPGGHR